MEKFGLSSKEARLSIITEIKHELDLHILRSCESKFKHKFTEKHNVAIVVVCVSLVLSSAFGLTDTATFISVGLIIISLLMSVLFQCASARIMSAEIILRIMDIVKDFETKTAQYDENISVNTSANPIFSGLQHGNSQSSIFITLRGNEWHRLPVLLMTKGDIFALMSGSYPPALCVELKENGLCETSRQLKATDRSESRKRSSSSAGYCEPLPHDSTQILSYSGDIRCFKLLETPVVAHVVGLLRSDGPPTSLIRKVCTLIGKYSWNMLIITLCLCLMSGVVRVLVIQSLAETQEFWIELIFCQTFTALIPLLPFCFPVILVIGEALMTAWLLTTVNLCNQRWAQEQSRDIETSRLYHTMLVLSDGVFGIGDMIRKGFVWLREALSVCLSRYSCKSTCTDCSSGVSRPILCYEDKDDEGNDVNDEKSSGDRSIWNRLFCQYKKAASSSAADGDVELGRSRMESDVPDMFEEDVEDKSDGDDIGETTLSFEDVPKLQNTVSTLSTRSIRGISVRRMQIDKTDDEIVIGSGLFWAYFREVMNFRLARGIDLLVTDSLTPSNGDVCDYALEVPLSRLHILETLGAINMISFVDDDTVCSPESIVEEVFFLSSEDNGTDGMKSFWEKQFKVASPPKQAANPASGDQPSSRVILDLHAKVSEAFAPGCRFEDNNWVRYMASLKPIGLACAATWKHPLDTFSVEYWSHASIAKRMNKVLSLQGSKHDVEAVPKHESTVRKIGAIASASVNSNSVALADDDDDDDKTVEDSPDTSPTHEAEAEKETIVRRDSSVHFGAFGYPGEHSHDETVSLVSDPSITSRSVKSKRSLEPISLDRRQSSGREIERVDSGTNVVLTCALKSDLSTDSAGIAHKDVSSGKRHRHKHYSQGFFNLFRPRNQQLTDKVDSVEDIVMKKLVERLSISVPSGHLREFSENIGFLESDLCHYMFKADLQVVTPNLEELQLVEDYHALGIEESRRRGRLRAGLRSVVVQQKIDPVQCTSPTGRSRDKSIAVTSDSISSQGPFQLLSKGKLEVVLAYSSTYWDGQAVSALTERELSLTRSAWQQWSLADYDVTALSYAPLPFFMHDIIMSGPISELPNSADKNDTSSAGVKRDDKDASRVHRATSRKYHHSRKYHKTDGDDKELSYDEVNKEADCEVNLSMRYRDMDPVSANSRNLSLIAAKSPMIFLDRRVFCPELQLPLPGQSDSSILSDSKSELSQLSIEVEPAKNDLVIRSLLEEKSEISPISVESPSAESMKKKNSKKQKKARRSRRTIADKCEHEERSKLRRDAADEVDFSKDLPVEALLLRKIASSNQLSEADEKQSPIREAASQSSYALPILQTMSKEQCFWNAMQEQTFLGMVASSVPPRRGMPQFVERMVKCGIRFQYFSPRNMRRTKSLAEKLGIETDWNCAISLRKLDVAGVPDPHRMPSSYADWDVLAKMPHGVDSIRRHLRDVDNVPLLVSLFTDSTPSSTRDMFKVLQDYDQVVMAVGSSYRLANSSTFSNADISIPISLLPGDELIGSEFSSSFTKEDIVFNSRMISVTSCCSLGSLFRRNEKHKKRVDYKSMNQVLQFGRRILANIHQSIAFSVIACLSLSLSVSLASICLPISLPPAPRPVSVMILLYCVISLISLGLLFSRVGASTLNRVANKNLSHDLNKLPSRAMNDVKKFIMYAVVHAFPSAILSIGMSWWAISTSVRLGLVPELEIVDCVDASTKFLCRIDIVSGKDSLNDVKDVLGMAGDVSILVMSMCLWIQSASFVSRMYHVFSKEGMDLIKNSPMWLMTVLWSVLMMVAYFGLSFSRGHVYQELLIALPAAFWVVLCVCPLVSLAVSEIVKMRESKFSKRQADFLRLDYDTRLGMHSPR